jgi:hypothetical protein
MCKRQDDYAGSEEDKCARREEEYAGREEDECAGRGRKDKYSEWETKSVGSEKNVHVGRIHLQCRSVNVREGGQLCSVQGGRRHL